MKRKTFIRQMAIAGAMLSVPNELLALGHFEKITILHTNDTHSRIDPFPMDGGKWQGLGGFAARAAMIQQIRKQEKHVLLLDSGDILQGTPYFNFFGGEPEFKGMTAMGYDAVTLGNHDFDAGISGLKKLLPLAGFDILTANYDFSDTELTKEFKPYRVIRKGNINVGIFGLGVELNGLVPSALFGNTRYLDPVSKATETARHLKHEENCHLVICLSHLGYSYTNGRVSDITLAKQTECIDIILGGHTHTLLEDPVIVSNKKSEPVVIHQSGWGGTHLGRIDVFLNAKKEGKRIFSKPQKLVN